MKLIFLSEEFNAAKLSKVANEGLSLCAYIQLAKVLVLQSIFSNIISLRSILILSSVYALGR
jgi:hypothetical protein